MINIDQHKWWTIGEFCHYLRFIKSIFNIYYRLLKHFSHAIQEVYRYVFYDRDLIKDFFEAREK